MMIKVNNTAVKPELCGFFNVEVNLISQMLKINVLGEKYPL